MRSEEELNKALDRGASTGLPPNKAPGWLGEVAPDFRRIDDFEPSLNAGLLQEDDQQQRWLLMFILYLTGIFSPIAVWMLWRDPVRSRRAKIVTTVAGVVFYAGATFAYVAING